MFDGENPTVFSLLAELAAVSEPALAGDLDEAPVTASLQGNLGALTQFVGMLKARETHGLRPLHVAARFNDHPTVIAALVDAGARVDASTVHDYTALHIAAGHARNPAVIAALLDAGAKLEARDSADGTPLHVAASTSDTPSVVKALIVAGANIDARDRRGRTPLQRAQDRYYSAESIVEALLEAGADSAGNRTALP